MVPFDQYSYVFFWNYKRMDNSNYNFRIVEALCYAKNNCNNNELFNKPITIIIMAIVECILFDFIKRVNEHNIERIPNLDQSVINKTRSKTLKMFKHIITHAKKYNLMLLENKYDEIDELRELRNRVHIQNDTCSFDKNEYKLWNDKNAQRAGRILKEICEILCNYYPRPGKEIPNIEHFPQPWL